MVGEKDPIVASDKGGKSNERILVRVGPTLKTSMPSPLCRIVMITKDLSSAQRYGSSYDWSVPENDLVPEETPYVHTI